MTVLSVPRDYLAVYLPKEIKQKFKVLCVLEDRDMSEVATELVLKWIAEKEDQSDRSAKDKKS